MTFRKISIIGTGLIGGSIALSLKQSKGYDFIITGFDIDPSSLDIALELGAINKKANSIEEAVNDADVVFPMHTDQGDLTTNSYSIKACKIWNDNNRCRERQKNCLERG